MPDGDGVYHGSGQFMQFTVGNIEGEQRGHGRFYFVPQFFQVTQSFVAGRTSGGYDNLVEVLRHGLRRAEFDVEPTVAWHDTLHAVRSSYVDALFFGKSCKAFRDAVGIL